jgi:hypothetical protein
MILLRKIAVVGTAVVALGCHDPAGPPTLPAVFSLSSIDGRRLPTPLSNFPESPVVTYGSVFLGADGNASITENRQTMTAPGEVSTTSNYTYTIRGNMIEFHLDCPPTAFCSAPPVGVFNGLHLYLSFKAPDGNLTYDYQEGVIDLYPSPLVISTNNAISE